MDHEPAIKCLILVVMTSLIFMASVMWAQLLIQSVRSGLCLSLLPGTAGARSWSCGWKRVEDGGWGMIIGTDSSPYDSEDMDTLSSPKSCMLEWSIASGTGLVRCVVSGRSKASLGTRLEMRR